MSITQEQKTAFKGLYEKIHEHLDSPHFDFHDGREHSFDVPKELQDKELMERIIDALDKIWENRDSPFTLMWEYVHDDDYHVIKVWSKSYCEYPNYCMEFDEFMDVWQTRENLANDSDESE